MAEPLAGCLERMTRSLVYLRERCEGKSDYYQFPEPTTVTLCFLSQGASVAILQVLVYLNETDFQAGRSEYRLWKLQATVKAEQRATKRVLE